MAEGYLCHATQHLLTTSHTMKKHPFTTCLLLCVTALLNAQENPRLIAFNSDATTGISTNKLYTHAHNFGVASGTLVINGVTFTNTTATASSVDQQYGWRSFPGSTANNNNNIVTPTGNQIRTLLNSLNYGISSGTMYITGLEAGVLHEIRFYNRAWEAGYNRNQRITFRPNGTTADAIEFNPDATPVTDQILVYRYTAQESGELAIQLTQLGGGTYHVYGFSNEKVWEMTAQPATLAGDTYATLNGRLITPGKSTTIVAQWKVDDGDDSEASWQGAPSATVGTFTTSGSFSLPIDTLEPQTIYAFRFVTNNGVMATKASTFETRGQTPVLAVPKIGEISFDRADVSGDVLYAGATGFVDVTLFWGTTSNAWTGQLELGVKEAGALAGTMATLLYATDYYCAFRATTDTYEAWSDVLKFRTGGEAVLGVPSSIDMPALVVLNIPLVDIGAAETTVTCWVGTSPDALTSRHTWPAAFMPRTFSLDIDDLPEFYYAFSAVNTMPDTFETREVWSATNSATFSSRVLMWINPANNPVWDTVTANWRENGAAATFASGDSVIFNGTSSPELTQDIDVGAVTVTLTTDWTGWELHGTDRTLTLYDAMRLNGPNGGYTPMRILGPVLAGRGSVSLGGAHGEFGAAKHTFTGGLSLTYGELAASIAAGADATLGAGDVALGAARPVPKIAQLTLSKSAGDELALRGATALSATGGFNTGRLILDAGADDAATLTARFGSLLHGEGGAMTLAVKHNAATNPGANERLVFDGHSSGLLPPWFVIEKNGGEYAAHDDIRGVTVTNLPAGLNAPYARLASNETLFAPVNATALLLQSALNLGGSALNLGANGAGGLLMRASSSITNAVASGRINMAANDLYVYAGQDTAVIHTPVDGSGVFRKFGAGTLRMTSPSLPAQMTVQQGTLELAQGVSFTYNGKIWGTGSLVKNNPGVMTFTGNNAPMSIGNLTVNSGAIRFMEGESVIVGGFAINTDAILEIDNAKLTVNAYSSTGHNGARGKILVQPNGHLVAAAINMGNNTGGTKLVVNGGRLTGLPNGYITVGDQGSDNHLDIFNNAVVDMATAEIKLGGRGNANRLVISNATASINHLVIGGQGSLNEGRICGAANVTANYVVVGNDWGSSSNTLWVGDSSLNMPGGTLRTGYHAVNTGNIIEFLDGARVNAAHCNVGYLGSGNTMRVNTGATVTLSGNISMGMNNDPFGNVLQLAGGEVSAVNLQVNSDNGFAIEIQANGLTPATFSGRANFATRSFLRPRTTVKDAYGTYKVLTASGGITIADGELPLDLPTRQLNQWSCWVDGNDLYIKYKPQPTLFILK